MRTIDDRTAEILAGAAIEGPHLRLVGQVGRDDYARVNKVLEALGGKWNRKVQAHVFSADPREALATVLGTGIAPLTARAAEGYVATPPGLAARIVELAYVPGLPAGSTVLEPSAGDGAIVRAVLDSNPGVHVWAVEPNADRLDQVSSDVMRVSRVESALEDFAACGTTFGFAAVVMNPPFAMPGQPTVWIDHVRIAWDLLAPGGRLVAIVPSGFAYRKDSRHGAMRDLVAERGGYEELPADAFIASGTAVRTVVLWLDRPAVTS